MSSCYGEIIYKYKYVKTVHRDVDESIGIGPPTSPGLQTE